MSGGLRNRSAQGVNGVDVLPGRVGQSQGVVSFCWLVLFRLLALASFSIDVINYFDQYNLRENGFILTHSSGYCPSWWRGEGKKKVKAEHAVSVLREWWVSAPTQLPLHRPGSRPGNGAAHGGRAFPPSVNSIKIVTHGQAQSQTLVILDFVTLTALTWKD